MNIFFGSIDGTLNALPIGDNLYYCGKNSEEQRTALFEMYGNYTERKLTRSVYSAYVALRYYQPVAFLCYTGVRELVDNDGLTKLW